MLRRGLPCADRRLVDAGRLDSRHAHDRLRRRRRDDHADAHRARSQHLRARRARGGPLGRRPARLVHDAGRAGVLGFRVHGSGFKVRFRVQRFGSESADGLHGPDEAEPGPESGDPMTTWTGCGTALVTPFTRDGALDERAVRRSRGGRSTPASTSSFRAARPARARRSRTTSACASSSSSSRKRTAGCRSSPAPAATTRAKSSRARCG